MGADIHSFAERKIDNKWQIITDKIFNGDDEPFSWRDYSIFGFLANVRNYDHCEPISERKGFPNDSEYLNTEIEDDTWSFSKQKTTEKILLEESDFHSASFLTLKELLDFDYNKTFWNRRIGRATYRSDGSVSGHNGAALAEEGEGEVMTYKQSLGDEFFKVLDMLKALGEPENVRIVFYFDS